jgi:hypothetical protein
VKAFPRSPTEIFGYHLRYVVPLFQRPYVWTKDDQWEPLWQDVQAIAERLVDLPPQPFGSPEVPPHFLGAIVVEQQRGAVGFIATWHVVDGQQRLTTLQLLLDAAQEVVERQGADMDAQALRVLVLNEPNIAQHPYEVFKVWPTDRDQDAFRAAMDNATSVPPDLRSSRIVQAHDFFTNAIEEWAVIKDDPSETSRRLNSLVRALRDHLRVVVIDLEPGDNAQVIFETLNHRGSRLLAADLIKNLIFQRAQAEGADVAGLYKAHWRELDNDYWRQLVAQGRLYRPRIDVFLNYWLTMKLTKDVPADRVFTEFRDSLLSGGTSVQEIIKEISRDAAIYASFDSLPAGSVEATFFYRVVRALDSGVVTPVMLWLLRLPGDVLSLEQRRLALKSLENWLARRTLVRLTGKNINQVILELLKQLDEGNPSQAGTVVEDFLNSQTAPSRLWPDDQMVRASLSELSFYKALVRPRVRMFLEAIEDQMRKGTLGEGQPCPRNLTVEHVMPQGWREHWNTPEVDPIEALKRDQRVQRLGNLTLVTGTHNSALSNRPWIASAERGKRDYLLGHSQLSLNSTIVKDHPRRMD